VFLESFGRGKVEESLSTGCAENGLWSWIFGKVEIPSDLDEVEIVVFVVD